MKAIANGVAQYYQRYGAGPTVVLIHALGLDHRLWDRQISDLSASCQVIVYDLRGHGETDIPTGPYDLDDFAEDLAGLLEALGVEHAHLVGISLGGIIAQQFALSWPDRVRSLVLADTVSEYNQDTRRQLAERARIAEERGMAPLVATTMDRWFTPSFRREQPEMIAWIHEVLAATSPVGYAASSRAIAGVDLTERLVSVGAPALILVGSEDTVAPLDAATNLHEHLPGSRLEVIAEASHLTNLARPDDFNRAVLALVHQAEPGGDDNLSA